MFGTVRVWPSGASRHGSRGRLVVDCVASPVRRATLGYARSPSLRRRMTDGVDRPHTGRRFRSYQVPFLVNVRT